MTTETAEVLPGIFTIDTRMAGRRHVTSAYLVRASEPALVETGPTTSIGSVLEGLGALGMGPRDLAHVVVTHIHLDHAGGLGRLARRFPRATVWIHQRGAPHMADPERLVRSAARVYGEERMRELFGPVDPVPADRIRALDEGDRIALGERTLEVLYTPGHASHHVALADTQTGAVWTGDALGIHLPEAGVLRPATPPPDVDVEQAEASIGRIRDRAGTALLFSHYGKVSGVEELCEIAVRRLRRWANIVREAMDDTEDLDRVAALLEERTDDELAAPRAAGIDLGGYEALGTMRMNAAGLVRYWSKRAEREAARRASS